MLLIDVSLAVKLPCVKGGLYAYTKIQEKEKKRESKNKIQSVRLLSHKAT